jgi:hypothetical protein
VPLLIRHPGADPKQVTQQRFISLRRIIERLEMLAWDDQKVHGCLRVDVANDYASLVVVDQVARNLAIDDFAKQAIRF